LGLEQAKRPGKRRVPALDPKLNAARLFWFKIQVAAPWDMQILKGRSIEPRPVGSKQARGRCPLIAPGQAPRRMPSELFIVIMPHSELQAMAAETSLVLDKARLVVALCNRKGHIAFGLVALIVDTGDDQMVSGQDQVVLPAQRIA